MTKRELKDFEEKYGLTSAEFYRAYKIIEGINPNDVMYWAAYYGATW